MSAEQKGCILQWTHSNSGLQVAVIGRGNHLVSSVTKRPPCARSFKVSQPWLGSLADTGISATQSSLNVSDSVLQEHQTKTRHGFSELVRSQSGFDLQFVLPAAHCTEGGEAQTRTGCMKITSWAPSSSDHVVQGLVKSANHMPAGKTALDSMVVWVQWPRSAPACMSSPTPGHLSFVPTDWKIRLCSSGRLHKDLQPASRWWCWPASLLDYFPSSTVVDGKFPWPGSFFPSSRFPSSRCEEILSDYPAARLLSSLLARCQALSCAMCHTPFWRAQSSSSIECLAQLKS